MKQLSSAWKHIRRTPYQSIAAICMLFLTFLAISVFAFIVFGSSVIISYFESKPQVTAFFTEAAQQSDIDALETQLKQTGKIANIKFISKEEALQIYKEQNKNDPLLLELVTEDILPASLEISTSQVEDLNAVSDMLKDKDIVSEVVYQKDIVASLTKWTNAIRLLGVILITILSLVSVFIMMIVIGFKVSQKRDEIEIMKLLSATNWYIRWPFVFEGVFYGTVGAFLGWLVASGGLLYATPYLQTFLKGIPILPVSPLFLFELLVSELLIAGALGLFASILAVRRYLV